MRFAATTRAGVFDIPNLVDGSRFGLECTYTVLDGPFLEGRCRFGPWSTLVERAVELTRGAFGEFIGDGVASYMRQSLQKLGVTIQDHTAVTEITPNEIHTDSGTLPYDICLWTPSTK